MKIYSAKAKEIFVDYKKRMFYREKQLDKEKNDIIDIVDFALETIGEENAFLLKNEFIEKTPKNWWDEYYSRSTYYRIKLKALQEFLEFLK